MARNFESLLSVPFTDPEARAGCLHLAKFVALVTKTLEK